MKDILNKLLIIASVGLAVAGVIFLVIAFTGKFDGTWPLAASLACLHSLQNCEPIKPLFFINYPVSGISL